MMNVTFPVSFAALAAAAQTTVEYLTEEAGFCAILVGPDRAATIAAFERFVVLLDKAEGIELNGYRPADSGAPEFAAQLEMSKTISTMFGSSLAGVHALESAETSDINLERFVGAILSMARDIPELERSLDVLIAKRSINASPSSRQADRDIRVSQTPTQLPRTNSAAKRAHKLLARNK